MSGAPGQEPAHEAVSAAVFGPSSVVRGLAPELESLPGPVTARLYDRLTNEDIERVRTRLTKDHQLVWEQATQEERKRLMLGLGLLYSVDGFAERTGLVGAHPPAAVHSMARGMITEIGGSYYYADLVIAARAATGRPIPAGAACLDFSCSSGRVVRALAAAYPEVNWCGCDPNSGAIEWARDHITGADFLVSSINPPLPYAPGSFELVFAISVWSHYSPAAARRWLDEMHRIVTPGGHLLLTAHGVNSCVWFTDNPDHAIKERLGSDWIARTGTRLVGDGHCFWDVFGDEGDWGVVDADWGLAFFTPEWLLASATPAWSVCEYRIGRAGGNQDVYLLERR